MRDVKELKKKSFKVIITSVNLIVSTYLFSYKYQIIRVAESFIWTDWLNKFEWKIGGKFRWEK